MQENEDPQENKANEGRMVVLEFPGRVGNRDQMDQLANEAQQDLQDQLAKLARQELQENQELKERRDLRGLLVNPDKEVKLDRLGQVVQQGLKAPEVRADKEARLVRLDNLE